MAATADQKSRSWGEASGSCTPRTGLRLTIDTFMTPTTYSFSFADAWAKTTDGQVSVHLFTHCRIAGAVARILALRDQYSWTSGLPILCASHDVGKMSAPFLSQCPSWMSDHGLAQLIDRWRLSKIRHEVFSQATISDILDERGQSLMGARIVGAHHGRWQTSDPGEIDLFEVREFFKAERRALVDLLESEFGRLPEEAFSQSQARYLAGAVAIADWIASNGEFFPYHDDYPPEACGLLAAKAVTQIGLIPQPFVPRMTFEQCFGFEPNPLQKAIGELPLDKGLYLLEADTGSGKTESTLVAQVCSTPRGPNLSAYAGFFWPG
jgi:CRISPR-associated endonuclease Cas3-HD